MDNDNSSSNYKRLVAKKVWVNDIITGEYIKKSGWEPSYFITQYGNISRINIIGFIVSTEQNSFILDDGTGNISIRFFDSAPNIELSTGDLAIVIGRPRRWNNDTYIVPEIVKKVDGGVGKKNKFFIITIDYIARCIHTRGWHVFCEYVHYFHKNTKIYKNDEIKYMRCIVNNYGKTHKDKAYPVVGCYIGEE